MEMMAVRRGDNASGGVETTPVEVWRSASNWF